MRIKLYYSWWKIIGDDNFGQKIAMMLPANPPSFDFIAVKAKTETEHVFIKKFCDTQFPGSALQQAQEFVKKGNQRLDKIYELQDMAILMKDIVHKIKEVQKTNDTDQQNILSFVNDIYPMGNGNLSCLTKWAELIIQKGELEAKRISFIGPSYFDQKTILPIPEHTEDL